MQGEPTLLRRQGVRRASISARKINDFHAPPAAVKADFDQKHLNFDRP